MFVKLTPHCPNPKFPILQNQKADDEKFGERMQGKHLVIPFVLGGESILA